MFDLRRIFIMNHTNPFLVAISAIVIVLGFTLTPAGVANAGNNGQQLLLANACSNPQILTWVKVTGSNQNGKVVTWQSWPNKSSVLTSGWWWKGTVSIEWRTNRDSYAHSTADVVPTQFQRDYWVTLLDKWGC